MSHMQFLKRNSWWIVIVLIVLGGSGWLYWEATKPLPGNTFADLGREHTNDISGIAYNSNPPTTGTHFPIWAKRGVYDRILSDGYLLHSLEHGYIVISYDCTKPIAYSQWPIADSHAQEISVEQDSTEQNQTETSVQSEGEPFTKMTSSVAGRMSAFTPETAPPVEMELPADFSSNECLSLKNDLARYLDVAERVIITPRVGMDTPIAVTAWNRLLKLDSIDKTKIQNFVNTFHNRGPEKTQE